MPTYEYKCEACSHQVEVFARMSDPPPAACEECGSAQLVKVLFPVAVHYKGSGFYSTDYAGKKAATSGGSGDASSDSKPASSEGGSSSSSDGGSSSSGSTASDSGSKASSSDA